MNKVKVISLLQPWASLLVMGHKTIETRSWNTKYRGELYIHASKRKIIAHEQTYDLVSALEEIPGFIDNYAHLPYGAIIGKVNLNNVFQSENFFTKDQDWSTGIKISKLEMALGDYSPNRFGWDTDSPIQFSKPTPAKGQLRIWSFDKSQLLEV